MEREDRIIKFRGMLLQEISRSQFDREENAFKLVSWNSRGYKRNEWYFRLIKREKKKE